MLASIRMLLWLVYIALHHVLVVVVACESIVVALLEFM
jgi:hypothetical protein